MKIQTEGTYQNIVKPQNDREPNIHDTYTLKMQAMKRSQMEK